MSGSETVFAVAGGAGFILLFVMLFLGDFDHEMELGDGIEHDAGISDGLVPSWFSIKLLAASAVGFGAVGFSSSMYGVPVILAWLLALIGTVAVGAGTYFWVLKPLARMQGNITLSRSSYRGLEAKVTLEITASDSGAVSFRDANGSYVELPAILVDEGTLPVGATVFIVDTTQTGVTVMPSSNSPEED